MIKKLEEMSSAPSKGDVFRFDKNHVSHNLGEVKVHAGELIKAVDKLINELRKATDSKTVGSIEDKARGIISDYIESIKEVASL